MINTMLTIIMVISARFVDIPGYQVGDYARNVKLVINHFKSIFLEV